MANRDDFERYCDQVAKIAERDGLRSDIYRGEDGAFFRLFNSGVPPQFAMQEALVEEDGF